MKNLTTRRELLSELFSKDVLKNAFGAYNEFTKAQSEVKKSISCDDAARQLRKAIEERSEKFYKNIRKEG